MYRTGNWIVECQASPMMLSFAWRRWNSDPAGVSVTGGQLRIGRRALKVLCELGRWKSPKTVLECYQQADLESQRAMQASRDQPTPPAQLSNPAPRVSFVTRCI